MLRLRQVALAAPALDPAVRYLRAEFGLREPFSDPLVAAFGLENAVFEIGDTFLEVVAPVAPDAPAARFLARRDGVSGGYMAIFQVGDIAAVRRRMGDLGVRIVVDVDFEDMGTMHLHPSDVGGAIVSLDWSEPPNAWRWAGPRWTGGAPAVEGSRWTEITVAADDPGAMAARWAAVLDLTAERTDGEAWEIAVDGGQRTRFRPAAPGEPEGIVAVAAERPGGGGPQAGGDDRVRRDDGADHRGRNHHGQRTDNGGRADAARLAGDDQPEAGEPAGSGPAAAATLTGRLGTCEIKIDV